jgi:hypothetical protein
MVFWSGDKEGREELQQDTRTPGSNGDVYYLHCSDALGIHICQNITNCIL